jgi:hypothetical protein
MFKDTCLVGLKRKDQSPRIIDLEILIYLILYSSLASFKTNSPNGQTYNQTNSVIISMGIA